MANPQEQLHTAFATLFVLFLLSFALRERRPAQLFSFDAPNPNAGDALTRELTLLAQSVWDRRSNVVSARIDDD